MRGRSHQRLWLSTLVRTSVEQLGGEDKVKPGLRRGELRTTCTICSTAGRGEWHTRPATLSPQEKTQATASPMSTVGRIRVCAHGREAQNRPAVEWSLSAAAADSFQRGTMDGSTLVPIVAERPIFGPGLGTVPTPTCAAAVTTMAQPRQNTERGRVFKTQPQ
jgi:hypothetical protein